MLKSKGDVKEKLACIALHFDTEMKRPKKLPFRSHFLCFEGKKVSFDKVIKMIDDMVDKVIKMIHDMVALLKKEQYDDDDKKEVCEKQLDKAEDDLKVLETSIVDLEKSIEDSKEEVSKGQVLNTISAYTMNETKDITPNALIELCHFPFVDSIKHHGADEGNDAMKAMNNKAAAPAPAMKAMK